MSDDFEPENFEPKELTTDEIQTFKKIIEDLEKKVAEMNAEKIDLEAKLAANQLIIAKLEATLTQHGREILSQRRQITDIEQKAELKIINTLITVLNYIKVIIDKVPKDEQYKAFNDAFRMVERSVMSILDPYAKRQQVNVNDVYEEIKDYCSCEGVVETDDKTLDGKIKEVYKDNFRSLDDAKTQRIYQNADVIIWKYVAKN